MRFLCGSAWLPHWEKAVCKDSVLHSSAQGSWLYLDQRFGNSLSKGIVKINGDLGGEGLRKGWQPCDAVWFVCFKKNVYFYLAMPGPSAVHGIFGLNFRMWVLQLWHVGSSSLTRDWTLGPLLWELRVLATGPPGKHLFFYRVFRDGLNWFNSIMYSFVIGIGGICLAYGWGHPASFEIDWHISSVTMSLM